MTSEAAMPRRMGRYQLLERLPGGGMTEVYRARVAAATGPERPLVVKLLPEEMARDAAAEARFVEEAKIALMLGHGNIVATFEAGRDEGGQPFLVMEYVHGHSLRHVLAGGALPPELALFVAREVSRALRYTHTFVDPAEGPSPIAHLDVSPENVLISHAGQVKLTDFGIARAVRSLAGRGRAYGKAPYAAPELLTGDPGGPPADVYALGCVLYEMLTGRPPYRGADDRETLRLACEGPVAAPPSSVVTVGPEIDTLVARMLEREKAARIADAGEVERTLSGILGKHETPLTEAELAELMVERGAAGAGPGRRERLRAQLAAAGMETGGHESTGALLSLGTVPLEAQDAAAPPGGGAPAAALAKEGRAASPARRFAVPVLGALFVVAAGTGAFAWHARGARDEKGTTAPGPMKPTPPAPIPAKTSHAPSKTAPPTKVSKDKGALGKTPPAAVPTPHPRPTHPRREVRRDVHLAPAVLQINAYPYAQVHLDKKALGTTPLRNVEIRPGRHKLYLVNPELHLHREIDLDLSPGQHRTIGVRLDR